MAPFVTVRGRRSVAAVGSSEILVFQVPGTDILIRHTEDFRAACVTVTSGREPIGRRTDKRRRAQQPELESVTIRRTFMIYLLDLAAEALWNDRVAEYEWSPQYQHWQTCRNFEPDAKRPKMDKKSIFARMQEAVESYAEALVQDASRDRAAKVILRQFQKANVDPSYQLCRNRLLYEHSALVS